MNISLQNRIKSDMNTTTMSDLVFLLLIFFMIVSTFVSPNVINLLLPNSDSGKQSTTRNIEVYINEAKEFFVNPKGANDLAIPDEMLLPALQQAVAEDKAVQHVVILRSDKSVPVENIVYLIDIINKVNETLPQEDRYKVLLATEAKD